MCSWRLRPQPEELLWLRDVSEPRQYSAVHTGHGQGAAEEDTRRDRGEGSVRPRLAPSPAPGCA